MSDLYHTAEGVYRYFSSTQKKHLFITGAIGSGKTVLCKELAQLLQIRHGIVTKLVCDPITQVRRRVTMQMLGEADAATIGEALNGAEQNGAKGMRRMRPVMEGFERHGVRMIEEIMDYAPEWMLIDEIGYLETKATLFQEGLDRCLLKMRVLAVLRKGDTPLLKKLYAYPSACLVDLDCDDLLADSE